MPTLFSDGLYSVTQITTDVVPKPNNWAMVIICFLLLLFTLLIVPYRRKYTLIVKALFSQRNYSLLMREGRILEENIYPLQLMLGVLTFSFGLTIIVDHFQPMLVQKITYIGMFGLLTLMLFALFGLKFLIMRMYIKLFDRSRERYHIDMNKFIFITISSLVLLPVLAVVQITHSFLLLYAYIPVFVVFLFFYIYNLLKINPKSINLFQFFVYFCTLEILPYVILVKFFATL